MKRPLPDYDGQPIEQDEKNIPLLWAVNNVKLPKAAPWDFTHRAWQFQIFNDMNKNLVVIKPTQIGMTTVMLVKMLHFATFHNVRVMYTLPRQDDVYDLVNGRLETMFRESEALAKNLGSINNVRFKEYARSYLHFMETSVTPRMLDVDYLVNDEVDMSDVDNLEQYIARLDASEYKYHIKISTPTITSYGIDALFAESDQKYWFVKCPACNHYQMLDWNDNVKRIHGEVMYCCSRCEKQLSAAVIQKGSWVAKFPSRKVSGYSVSQMMVTSIPPQSLWDDSLKMRPKNFHNLRLGKAYTPTTSGFSKEMIIERCLNNTHNKENNGSGYFLGADQGNIIHVVVGKLHEGVVRIVWAEEIPLERGFARLEELIDRYKIRKGVIDALPNRHSAQSLISKYGHKISMSFYTQGSVTYTENQMDNIVHINRSDAFDSLQESINAGRYQFYGTRDSVYPEIRTMINHIAALRRDETMKTTVIGGETAQVNWINTGPDHYAHALSYMNIAIDMSTSKGGLRVQEVGAREAQPDTEEPQRESRNPYAQNATLSRLRNDLRSKRRILG